MNKNSSDVFKGNAILVIVTFLLAFVVALAESMEPTYISGSETVATFIIFMPLISWWFMAFWNRILTRLFQLKNISYGVALVLTAAVAVLF